MNLVPVAIPSKTPMKNKAQAKELEPEFSPHCLSSLVTSQVACGVCAGFPYQSRTSQVGGKGRGSDTHQVEVRPTYQKKTSTRTHEEEKEEEEEDKVPLSLSQRRVRRTSRNQDPRWIICCWWCEVYCCSSAFWVVVEKGALAGICVVLVMSLVRVVVCVVLDLFVERCDGVVV